MALNPGEMVLHVENPPMAENQEVVIAGNHPPVVENQEMVTHEGEPPHRRRRGNRSTVDWATFNTGEVLAGHGWEQALEPWTRTTCQRYVDWAHINRHFPRERNETQVRSGVALIKYCVHPTFKKRLTEVALALWGTLSKKDGTLALCQMAYAEVFLGKDVDWNTYPAKQRGGRFPTKSRRIPPNPEVQLEGEGVAGAQGDEAAAADPMEVDNAPQGANEQNPVAPELEAPIAGPSEPMPLAIHPIPPSMTINEVFGANGELEALRALVIKLREDGAEAERRHEMEVQAHNARVKALEETNAKLLASNIDLLERERRQSTDGTPPLDEVVERATYGLIEPADPLTVRRVRPHGIFPTPHFRGESSNAATQSTDALGQEFISVERVAYDALVARAERAEGECNEAKANMETVSAALEGLQDELAFVNAMKDRLLQQTSTTREQKLLAMSNMRLACTLAMNEVAQLQREVRRIAAEFRDGSQRYFGLTSWARLEDMFPVTLPQNRDNASIDWDGHPHLDFQFNTARYRYGPVDREGNAPLLWPIVPEFVKDGTTCTICMEPFGPEGGFCLGTCGHMYHPGCLIPHMVTRKRCAQCKAPLHRRLYVQFGLEDYMPPHFELNEENLPGDENRGSWGNDMIWMWKWGHDSRHLAVRSVQDIPWNDDAEITEVCKKLISAGDPGRRVFFGQLAGGHWDLDRQEFVRQPHPENVVFDSSGNPIGILQDMDHEAQMRFIEDTTFNEVQMLSTISSYLHDRYDRTVVATLNSLQSREGLQDFLRNSIGRGIVEPEQG